MLPKGCYGEKIPVFKYRMLLVNYKNDFWRRRLFVIIQQYPFPSRFLFDSGGGGSLAYIEMSAGHGYDGAKALHHSEMTNINHYDDGGQTLSRNGQYDLKKGSLGKIFLRKSGIRKCKVSRFEHT